MQAIPTIAGHIPIRPDLLQFVRWRENLTPLTPLILPGHGSISAYLTDLILFARSFGPSSAGPPGVDLERVHLEKYTARLRFQAPQSLLDESFFLYADLVAHYFNQFLAQHWKEQVDAWSSVACYYTGMDRKDAIRDLHDISGMGDFREYETDIRNDHRLRDFRHLVKNRRGK